jgi:MbtH protein
VTNPFEDLDASYVVMVNAEGRHSLWPAFTDVPAGWKVIFGEAGYLECLDFIEDSRPDVRPEARSRP